MLDPTEKALETLGINNGNTPLPATGLSEDEKKRRIDEGWVLKEPPIVSLEDLVPHQVQNGGWYVHIFCKQVQNVSTRGTNRSSELQSHWVLQYLKLRIPKRRGSSWW